MNSSPSNIRSGAPRYTLWEKDENKVFEQTVAEFGIENPNLFQLIQMRIPGRSAIEIARHFQDLLDDLYMIESGSVPLPKYTDDPEVEKEEKAIPAKQQNTRDLIEFSAKQQLKEPIPIASKQQVTDLYPKQQTLIFGEQHIPMEPIQIPAKLQIQTPANPQIRTLANPQIPSKQPIQIPANPQIQIPVNHWIPSPSRQLISMAQALTPANKPAGQQISMAQVLTHANQLFPIPSGQHISMAQASTPANQQFPVPPGQHISMAQASTPANQQFPLPAGQQVSMAQAPTPANKPTGQQISMAQASTPTNMAQAPTPANKPTGQQISMAQASTPTNQQFSIPAGQQISMARTLAPVNQQALTPMMQASITTKEEIPKEQTAFPANQQTPVEGPERTTRGKPWNEEEHWNFLKGLKQFGKGDWKSISRYWVPSRTPTQVASHAQKHFLRLTNSNPRRRRKTIFKPLESSSANEHSP